MGNVSLHRVISSKGNIHSLEVSNIGSIDEGLAMLESIISDGRARGLIDPEEASSIAADASAPTPSGRKRGPKPKAEAAETALAPVAPAPVAPAPTFAPAPAAPTAPAAPAFATAFGAPAAPTAPAFGGGFGFSPAPAAPVVPVPLEGYANAPVVPVPLEGYANALSAIFASFAVKDAAEGSQRRQQAAQAIYGKHVQPGTNPMTAGDAVLKPLYEEIVTSGLTA